MEIEIIKSEKDDFEIRMDNVTIAELLRNYLNQVEGVNFVAWRREHISKPVILKVQTSGKTVKKAVSEAISLIEKESGKVLSGLKK